MTPAEKRRLTMLENKVNSLEIELDFMNGLWMACSVDPKTEVRTPHYLYKKRKVKYSKRKTYVDWSE